MISPMRFIRDLASISVHITRQAGDAYRVTVETVREIEISPRRSSGPIVHPMVLRNAPTYRVRAPFPMEAAHLACSKIERTNLLMLRDCHVGARVVYQAHVEHVRTGQMSSWNLTAAGAPTRGEFGVTPHWDWSVAEVRQAPPAVGVRHAPPSVGACSV